jgi:transcriptional regulator GlxA family with amidase domain
MVLQTKVKVGFYLQDGVEVLDFAGPMEVFSTAGFEVFTVSRRKTTIKAQGILTAVANYDIGDAPPADIIAFFGGETKASIEDTALISWIRARSKSSAYTFSVCTGAFLLARAGVLDHLTVTTYHSAINALMKAAPQATVVQNVRFVDNGTVITTAGVSAGLDGALHLVERLKGRDYARTVADLIEYDKWVPEQGLIIKK